ncbi:MAG: tRNA epoxyqueuosine(34) reductase QueG [Nitrospinae bacterium CG11_big_fil_rev_8_21_14_0_20_45_15]|nr:MAG: tRNA epoxyqueuosine(34) reductase QueG [Nitrospinae bacterium CG11_big_fil_rev_8_21_14_0_20_45_15]
MDNNLIPKNPSAVDKVKALQIRARELGFSGFGISPATLGDAGPRFRKWLAEGMAGEMGYIERGEGKRLDPNLVLPGVQSIVCLSTNYLTADKDMSFVDEKNTGDVSLYALNEDYHDLLGARLKLLEDALKQAFPECSTRRYVDTGPVLEKPLAQNAGLGWIGKHTNLITEGVGSWFFLSEILVDIPLPYSTPATDHCGTCTACIDVCPTRAIVAPYVLDSRKCISYLTIELKGPIPIEFRKAIGSHIYGCDDCQIVCPWNSFAHKTEEPAFVEREGTRNLIELMGLDDEGFRNRFRNSPVKRTKRRGLLRNVAIALGNSGNAEAIPVLTSSLEDAEALIRAHAVWALAELMGMRSLAVFDLKLKAEQDDMVLAEIGLAKIKFSRSPESGLHSDL